jgi:hypothetical protein
MKSQPSPIRRISARKYGLGDLVAAVAQPIARAVDRVAGTNLKGCQGCAKRRETLNRLTQRK